MCTRQRRVCRLLWTKRPLARRSSLPRLESRWLSWCHSGRRADESPDQRRGRSGSAPTSMRRCLSTLPSTCGPLLRRCAPRRWRAPAIGAAAIPRRNSRRLIVIAAILSGLAFAKAMAWRQVADSSTRTVSYSRHTRKAMPRLTFLMGAGSPGVANPRNP